MSTTAGSVGLVTGRWVLPLERKMVRSGHYTFRCACDLGLWAGTPEEQESLVGWLGFRHLEVDPA